MYTTDDILSGLSVFEPHRGDRCAEWHLPIILQMNGQCLTLRITPGETGFTVSDGAYTFEDFCENTEYYFDLFLKKRKKVCAGFEVKNEEISKKYEKNIGMVAALDECIRFFIALDEFIIKNRLR